MFCCLDKGAVEFMSSQGFGKLIDRSLFRKNLRVMGILVCAPDDFYPEAVASSHRLSSRYSQLNHSEDYCGFREKCVTRDMYGRCIQLIRARPSGVYGGQQEMLFLMSRLARASAMQSGWSVGGKGGLISRCVAVILAPSLVRVIGFDS
jgi:hypothetical protein